MAVTQIDLDDEAVALAMRLSGARTKKDTVNLALHAYIDSHERRRAFEHFVQVSKGWDDQSWRELRAADRTVQQ